jgi:hypothetical protein
VKNEKLIPFFNFDPRHFESVRRRGGQSLIFQVNNLFFQLLFFFYLLGYTPAGL